MTVLLRLIFLALIHLFAAIRLLGRDSAEKGCGDLGATSPARRPPAPERCSETGSRRPEPARRAATPAAAVRASQLHLLVSPDTVLRWHRDMLRRRWAATSRPNRAGRPAARRSIEALVVRLAKENLCVPRKAWRRAEPTPRDGVNGQIPQRMAHRCEARARTAAAIRALESLPRAVTPASVLRIVGPGAHHRS